MKTRLPAFLTLSVGALLTAIASLQAQTAPATQTATASAPATASQPARGGRGATPARTGAFAPDHNPALPTVFLIGDSTVKNSWDRGTDGLWGWGRPLAFYFDLTKINVDNQALGGTSSHSYQTANWPGVLKLIQKGDFVIMQFGTNDNGAASLKGNGDDTQAATGRGAGGDPLHSFGWYIRKYVTDTREKGATPIIASLVPRMTWKDGKIAREDDTHGGWAKAAAAQEKAGFIDL
ncbi:MAG TPA: GDSL-type esterase/lipase family protein, partial [Phycisphaerae bacterium]